LIDSVVRLTSPLQWIVEKTRDGQVYLKNANGLYLGINGAAANSTLVVARGDYKQAWDVAFNGSSYKSTINHFIHRSEI
jgi:hypothetical protein